MVDYLTHPLDGCRERVKRANEHFGELEREITVLFEKQANAVPFNLDTKPPHSPVNVRLPAETFAGLRLGTLIGEICYNLRCALDYLVYALAELDAGSPQKGTQFPIIDMANDFAGRGKAMLSGVNFAHVAKIEGLQPYNGCKWTGRLRDLSNMDKHRHIVPSGGNTQVTVHSGLEKDLTRICGFKRKAPHPITGEDVDVKVHILGEITFADRSLVIDTLYELKTQVANTLQHFGSEF
jgi:hypothetical protein